MKHLRLRLESIELILNTAKWMNLANVDVEYWTKERSTVLKEILELQLMEFDLNGN